MPVPASPARKTLRAHIARASGKFADPKVDVDELRREFKTETIADYIRALANSAPALTTEQRDRLALLLRGSGRAERTDAA